MIPPEAVFLERAAASKAAQFNSERDRGTPWVVLPHPTESGWIIKPLEPTPVVEDVLDEAKRITAQDRGRDYGHPLDNLGQIAALWSTYLGVPITYRQVSWMMMLTKCSRDSHSPKRDNLVDAAGYARIAQVALEESERRAK
jgi:hypothetical protein